MCGRYVLRSSTPELARLLGAASALEASPRFNIAPAQEVPVCRVGRHAQRELVAMRWGLVPGWMADDKRGYRMINARAETLVERPAFRAALRRRRCLIPADGFYEWQARDGRKQPHFICRKDGRPFSFAGLWERWEGPDRRALLSCTIVTSAANEVVAPIHPRMPVILNERDYPRWLDPAATDGAALLPLLKPCPRALLIAYPVSTLVNNPKHDDARCIAPLGQ